MNILLKNTNTDVKILDEGLQMKASARHLWPLQLQLIIPIIPYEIFSLRQAGGVLQIRWKSLPVSYDCSENILFSRSDLARATDVKKKKAVVKTVTLLPSKLSVSFSTTAWAADVPLY